MTKNKNKIKIVLKSIIIIALIIGIVVIVNEAVTINKKYYIGEKNLQIPILVYHDLVESEDEIEFDYMQSTAEHFEYQITGLMRLGYRPISYEDLVKYKNGEIQIYKRSFLITFDDGYDGVYDYAFPIAKKYNIPMTSFEIDENVGSDECYSWEQAKEMKESGLMSIYSHGYQHLEYDKETTEKLVELTNASYQNIVTNLNDTSILKVFTYPYGLYREDEILALEKEGFIQNLTDNKINMSNSLNLSKLHRCYPLNDSVFKIVLKIQYRALRYGG